MPEKKIIGLLIGRENTFPVPFLDIVNQRGAPEGISAELPQLKSRLGSSGPRLRCPNSLYSPQHEAPPGQRC